MPRKKLTAKFVEAVVAPTDKKSIDYFDSHLAGFSLRVSSKGIKSWTVIYRIYGRQRRFTIGRFPVLTLADARELARNALSSVAKGIDPADVRRQERTEPTFKDFAQEFVKRHAKTRKSGDEIQRVIQRELLPRFASRRAKDISRRDIIDMLDEIAERAPIMANRVLATVRKMYNWGIGRDIVAFNPCTQVQRPGIERQRQRILTKDEVVTFWSACDVTTKLIGNLFKLRLVTAQRGQEVINMRWRDIESGWWTIPEEFCKNGLTHRVPLSPLAVQLLAEIRDTSPWVFPSPTKPNHPMSAYQKAFQRIRYSAGIEDFKSHDLRRTAASHMTGLGVQRLVVSKILNHVETGVTAVYDRHSYDQEKRQALDLWGRTLQGYLDGPSAINNVVLI